MKGADKYIFFLVEVIQGWCSGVLDFALIRFREVFMFPVTPVLMLLKTRNIQREWKCLSLS